jgi:glucosamine--fructose-6-phosphate aminotransferase (isomerizing)
MCGIVGVISDDSEIIKTLMNGLYELQNRGYDSMGVCLMDQSGFNVHKDICHHQDDIARLVSYIDASKEYKNGIAHSRWATHGKITRENAHPHICFQNLFSLVHNGIIENFHTLKKQLLEKEKIKFQSDTDSEVVVNMMSFMFHKQPDDMPVMDRVIHSICSTLPQLQGTYGLVIQFRLLPNNLFCVRYGSPLVVGVYDNGVMIVSEKSALNRDVRTYVPIEDHDLIILQNDKIKPITRISDVHRELVFLKNTNTVFDDKGDYKTWTEKEIMEQPVAIERCIKNGSRILPDNSGVKLGGLMENKEKIDNTDHLILLGCGTSHHACLLVSQYFRSMKNRIQTVQVCDGSEFDVSYIPKSGNTTLIVLSQSGETMDLLLSIRKFRQAQPESLVLGVINVVDSVIARAVDAGLYTNSGKERGVASTKSFTTQVVTMYLIACFFSSCYTISSHLQIVRNLPLIVDHNLPKYFKAVRDKLTQYVIQFSNIFIVGKSFDYHIAMESALKIKEISYIHAEAYSSSSLKHGPFALLDEKMLVILLSNVPSERSKLENAYQEIKARHAPILVISYENINDCPYYMNIPYHYFSYLEANIVLQIVALELSLSKGIHPDYPKNLAKVVTVE